MNNNKKYFIGTLAAAVGFSLFLIFGVVYAAKDHRHTVTFFEGSKQEFYANSGPVAQIEASPAMAWQSTGKGWKVAGWAAFALMWVGFLYIAKNTVQGNRKIDAPGDQSIARGLLYTFVPLILSASFFFGGHSSAFVSNYKEVWKDRFDNWVHTGVVKQASGNQYTDPVDTIKNLFAEKVFLK